MKLNKTILVGIIFILIAGVIFITDILNPIIRPITYLFLMGSSKGKDIMFFGLMGLFLILSQLIKKDLNPNKYLKYSIVIGCVLLISGILLEIIFRLTLGIGMNTIFVSMLNGMSSTSILHSHLLKAILGDVLVNILGPTIGSDINTGVGLYSYVPSIAKFIILLIPILFITLVLSNQKREIPSRVLLAFFSSCLIIGAIDGGLFATPSIVGICGIYLIYRNSYYIDYAFGLLLNNEKLLSDTDKLQPVYRNKGLSQTRFLFNRMLPYIVVIFIIALRFSVAIAGAEPDSYMINIENPSEDIDFGNITLEKINETSYKSSPEYNEMALLNELKVPLKDKCDYYTLSWNIYSYF